MGQPPEFSSEYINDNSPLEEQLYASFLQSGEPYRSLYQADFHQSARNGYAANPKDVGNTGATPGIDLKDDELYYNTLGSATDYWKDYQLPSPSKDIKTLRADLKKWGYCLIEDALSKTQHKQLKERLEEQAAGERKAGLASWMGAAPAPGKPLPDIQFLHSLINKGEQFIQCVEHNPKGVQGGLVIEQLLNETVGEHFLMSSFIAIITNKHNMPQGLHQDQAVAPFQDPVAPFTCNTMYIMDDMCEHNGGTIVVPGSHKVLSADGSGLGPSEPMPPAISLEAPAGTVMVFEGRLLHGTGVNKSDSPRMILVMNSVKPFMRQQELHMLSAAPEVLANASGKLLYRLGARPMGLGGVEGAWNGDHLVNQRYMLENGEYKRIRALSANSPAEVLARDYGYRYSDIGLRQAPHQSMVDNEIKEKFADLQSHWQFNGEKFPYKKKRQKSK